MLTKLFSPQVITHILPKEKKKKATTHREVKN